MLWRLPAAAPGAFPRPRPSGPRLLPGGPPSVPARNQARAWQTMQVRQASEDRHLQTARGTDLAGRQGPLGPSESLLSPQQDRTRQHPALPSGLHTAGTGTAGTGCPSVPRSAGRCRSWRCRRSLTVCAQAALWAVVTLSPGSPVTPLPWPTTRSRPVRPLLSDLPNTRRGSGTHSSVRTRPRTQEPPRSSSLPRGCARCCPLPAARLITAAPQPPPRARGASVPRRASPPSRCGHGSSRPAPCWPHL